MKRTKILTRIRRMAEVEIGISFLLLFGICVMRDMNWMHIVLLVVVGTCTWLWIKIYDACYELLAEYKTKEDTHENQSRFNGKA